MDFFYKFFEEELNMGQRRKVTLLITGSIREVESANQVLNRAVKFKQLYSEIDRIIWSTTDDSESVMEFMRINNYSEEIELVWTPEPSKISKGHRHHQVLQLARGLELINDETWVLKMRTDKLILSDHIMKHIIDQILQETIPDDKIGILTGHIFLPWYINDMVYIGRKKLLKPLTDYNDIADIIAPMLQTEHVFWSSIMNKSERILFYTEASKNLYSYSNHPELVKENLILNEKVKELLNLLVPYWHALIDKFFVINIQNFNYDYNIILFGQELNMKHIYTRYGVWGSGFSSIEPIKEVLTVTKGQNK